MEERQRKEPKCNSFATKAKLENLDIKVLPAILMKIDLNLDLAISIDFIW